MASLFRSSIGDIGSLVGQPFQVVAQRNERFRIEASGWKA